MNDTVFLPRSCPFRSKFWGRARILGNYPFNMPDEGEAQPVPMGMCRGSKPTVGRKPYLTSFRSIGGTFNDFAPMTSILFEDSPSTSPAKFWTLSPTRRFFGEKEGAPGVLLGPPSFWSFVCYSWRNMHDPLTDFARLIRNP